MHRAPRLLRSIILAGYISLKPKPIRNRILKELLQFGVLGLGLLEDGDLRIGIFPDRQEILVRSSAFGGIALESVGTSQLEMR